MPCPPSPLWQGQGNPPTGVQRGRSDLERRSAASVGSHLETGSRASSGRGTGARPGWPAGPPHTGGRRRAEGSGGRSRLAGRHSPLAPPPGDAEGAKGGEIRASEGALSQKKSPSDWCRSGSELLTGSELPFCLTVIFANRLWVSFIYNAERASANKETGTTRAPQTRHWRAAKCSMFEGAASVPGMVSFKVSAARGQRGRERERERQA